MAPRPDTAAPVWSVRVGIVASAVVLAYDGMVHLVQIAVDGPPRITAEP